MIMKKIYKYIQILCFCMIIATVWSCSKETEYKEDEAKLIESYIKKYLTQPTADTIFPNIGGVYLTHKYTDSSIIENGDTLWIVYTGMSLQDNVAFATNDTLEIVYGKTKVIEGWEKIIHLLKYSDNGQLIIPYKYGYKKKPMGVIKPYSTLLFLFSVLPKKTVEENDSVKSVNF